MFVDTHCHIESESAKEYVENASLAKVNVLLNASVDLDTSYKCLEISKDFSNVYSCVGVHPSNVMSFSFEQMKIFASLINDRSVKAIGEIGLDYYYGKESKDLQIKMFREFLNLAQEYNLPVVIHSREATKDTIDILSEYNVKGVIHCFSGSLETAKKYISMGFCLGVGGILTFKNSRLFEVIREISLEYIVLETDAPYLTPEPYRKYKNESKYIPVIAQKLASYKEVSVEEVMDITTENAKRIFDI